jgi:putative membrane protein
MEKLRFVKLIWDFRCWHMCQNSIDTQSRPLYTDSVKKQSLINLDHRVAEVEKRTGAQIVLAVIDRSDAYPELPWKAFALGAAVAGLLVALQDMARPEWTSGFAVLFAVALTLAAGITSALLCVYAPLFARLFLDRRRASAEVRQHASALFLSREMFATSRRTGILLLVSLFERHVVVLPDTGLAQRLSQDSLQRIIARMTAALKKGEVERALEAGLDSLEEILAGTATGESGKNELANGVIEEKGQ